MIGLSFSTQPRIGGVGSTLSCALLTVIAALPITVNGADQSAAPFFREDWRQTPAALPVTQDHVANPMVVLSTHGPNRDAIKKSHHDEIPNDPWYIWSGSCEKGRWAISLRKKNALVDLSTDGRIQWRVKQSGGHVLKLILELDDGSWLVSDKGFGETPDWWEFNTSLTVLRWHRLDIRTVEAGPIVKNPNLGRVRSIGWTDLMVGRGSNGCTRVDWLEVYGRTVED